LDLLAASGWAATVLPSALVIAASPVGYLGALTLLTTERPLANAWAFAAGWFGVTIALFTFTYSVTSPDAPKVASNSGSGWHIALGVAAIVGAIFIWRKEARATRDDDEAPKQPAWAARMEHVGPLASFGLGLLLPTYALIPPAALRLKDLHVTSSTAVIAAVAFGIVATLGALIPTVLYATRRTVRDRLRAVRDLAMANQMKIGAALLGLIGISLLSTGLAAFF
jgi:hypothetical protein